jgi:cytochrome c553
MKQLIHHMAWLVLLPALAAAAGTARSDLDAALRATPDPVRGAELFANCTSCHGVDGGGETSGGAPRIAGQHYRVIVKQLVDFRHGKRWDFRMEGMADRHHFTGPQDFADVACYVSALSRPGKRGIGTGEFVEEGARIYAKHCQSCHGVNAEGDSRTGMPRLAGQHYSYLVRQMYDAVDGRRALPRLHSQRIEPFDYEQIRAISDYLARIGWQGEATSSTAETHEP